MTVEASTSEVKDVEMAADTGGDFSNAETSATALANLDTQITSPIAEPVSTAPERPPKP